MRARDLTRSRRRRPAAAIAALSVAALVLSGCTLLTDLLSRAPDIEAVACVNDDLALGVLFECQRRHISVPEEIAIVGFNDLEFMASAVPSLTSVRTNRYEMGRRAVTMVTAAIDGNRPPEPVVDLGFELMIRQSSSARAILTTVPRAAPIKSS